MATVRIVPEETWEVLKDYLFDNYGEVILVPESTLKKAEFPKEIADKLRTLNGKRVNFDFGECEEVDYIAKVAYRHDDYVVDCLLEELEDEDEE